MHCKLVLASWSPGVFFLLSAFLFKYTSYMPNGSTSINFNVHRRPIHWLAANVYWKLKLQNSIHQSSRFAYCCALCCCVLIIQYYTFCRVLTSSIFFLLQSRMWNFQQVETMRFSICLRASIINQKMSISSQGARARARENHSRRRSLATMPNIKLKVNHLLHT